MKVRRADLYQARQSCQAITGIAGALHTIADLAVPQTAEVGTTVDVDWCALQDLTDTLCFHVNEHPFAALVSAIGDAIRAEEQTHEQ